MFFHRERVKSPGYGKGFTLIELLVVISIIGLLSTIGTVSYQSSRRKARDAKRVSDVKQIQTAVEIYFETHSNYPWDRNPGDIGLPLGFPNSTNLTDIGFGADMSGMTYMSGIPRNPEPGGTDYIYRSLGLDGRNCDSRDGCDAYAIIFTLESQTGDYAAGTHALTPEGLVGEGFVAKGVVGAGGEFLGLETTRELIASYASESAALIRQVADDKRIETAAAVTAPAVATASIVNTAFTVHSSTSLVSVLLWIFGQPLMLLGGKRRKAWGTVYNSLSKMPVDLAIVRLTDVVTGRRVGTSATDQSGRFSFLVPAGKYALEVAKIGFAFPSAIVGGMQSDGRFDRLYFGGELKVEGQGELLTPNIPLDPVVTEESDQDAVRRADWKKMQRGIAVATPACGVVAFAITPSVFTAALLAAQLISYSLFRRLAQSREPKRWGIVYEKGVGKAIPQAILRMFALPYHKLVETQVADQHGRYHFRVGSGKFYLTAVKHGFDKTESEPLDLTVSAEPTVIASDIPLMRATTVPTVAAAAPTQRGGLIVGPGKKVDGIAKK